MTDNITMPTAEVFEKYLIKHCSPTLASIKTGNLFTIPYSDVENLNGLVTKWDNILKVKGVSLAILRHREGRALIYVYRRNKLSDDLQKSGVQAFLKYCGYSYTEVDYAVGNLSNRLYENENFPHEIGLFLGYPLCDVVGFILNEGKNCKCTGFWKVYSNQCEAEKVFEKFRRCISVYCRLWRQGRSVQQLTVSLV